MKFEQLDKILNKICDGMMLEAEEARVFREEMATDTPAHHSQRSLAMGICPAWGKILEYLGEEESCITPIPESPSAGLLYSAITPNVQGLVAESGTSRRQSQQGLMVMQDAICILDGALDLSPSPPRDRPELSPATSSAETFSFPQSSPASSDALELGSHPARATTRPRVKPGEHAGEAFSKNSTRISSNAHGDTPTAPTEAHTTKTRGTKRKGEDEGPLAVRPGKKKRVKATFKIK